MGSPRELETPLESDAAPPSEMSPCGGIKESEGQYPLSTGAGLTQQGQDDLGDLRVLPEAKYAAEWRRGGVLGKEASGWRASPTVYDPCDTRLGPQERNFTLSELGNGLEKQNISGLGLRVPREGYNLGVNKISASQETKPSWKRLPERLGRITKCPGYSVSSAPGGRQASVGRHETPPEEMERGPTGVVPSPITERTLCPVEVGAQLPQPQKPAPRTRLGLEPPACQFAQHLGAGKEGADSLEPGVESPHHIRPVYAGKFFDRTPYCSSAGKIAPIGYRVVNCLTEKLPRLVTPPEAKKFFSCRYPPAGAQRVFYGRANDPPIPSDMTHGIKSTRSIPASTFINPKPMTAFQQKMKDKQESIYFSNQRAPLGRSYDQTPGLPKGMDILNTTFGTAVIRELSARDVVNPPKSYGEVLKETTEGHDLYVISHNDYYAGEAKNRKYDSPRFHRFNLYGVPTPHFNDGRNMAKSLFWLHELQMKRGDKFVSKREDDFKEKFQHKLGRVLDPIAETMNVPPDHTFGACLRPEEYGVGDLIHNRLPGECLRGKDRQRALVAAVRHHLKKVNYQNFDTLLEAFRHYDKKGDGMIDKAELQEACDQANLHLDGPLLDELLDYCDVDKDGLISCLEFANFLTWKDKMPLKEDEERAIVKGIPRDCTGLTEARTQESEPALLIKPEDIVYTMPGSSEKTLRTLQRPSDKASNEQKTTSSEICAVVGAAPPVCCPIYGVPSVRSDIPVPRIRRISDRTNYGEDGNAYSLLYPTIFSQRGVFERDFFKTRSKEEIAQILCNIGVKLSDEEFENVWNRASQKHQGGEVCVESIRNVLDELHHADRAKCKMLM
ncbi:PREDICTED: EF-hand domain-containing family member B [Elephantulus edwardii]|uniref:EF-hand domain-containing family member B n=1 Tax=Elephantulus edwardii TaxID=28737 RepID=UPI0003F07C0B|nr:PREDICTED: EF-hand domain-containing family member B [Elephantulus edwardii]